MKLFILLLALCIAVSWSGDILGHVRLPWETSKFFPNHVGQNHDSDSASGTSGHWNYRQQVKKRNGNDNCGYDINLMLFMYMGTIPTDTVSQRDADLVYLWHKYLNAPDGSHKKLQAEKQLLEVISHRMHIENAMNLIAKHLFLEKALEMLDTDRPAGLPIVDYLDCLKNMQRTYETYCGSIPYYGTKYFFPILCNAGIQQQQMAEASAQACIRVPSVPWSSLDKDLVYD